MSSNKLESVESTGSQALASYQVAKKALQQNLQPYIQDVIDNPYKYMNDKNGMRRKGQKDIDLKKIYESLGIPVEFSARRTPEYQEQVLIIRDILRDSLRKEGYDITYGYANLEDNDSASIVMAESIYSLSESKYNKLTAANEEVGFVRGAVQKIFGKKRA